MSCSTIRMGRENRLWSSRSRAAARVLSAAVMPAVGSSSRSTRHEPASAMAISSHCFSPCERSPAGVAWRSARPVESSTSRAPVETSATRPARTNSRGDGRSAHAARAMFSATASEGTICGAWNLRLTPRRAKTQAGLPVKSCPNSETVPSRCRCWPLRMSSRVDLPAPFGPMRQCSPAPSMASDTSCSTSNDPKLLPISVASTTAPETVGPEVSGRARIRGNRRRRALRPAARWATRSTAGTSPSGTKITAATKMTPVPSTHHWSHTSASAAEAKLTSSVPATGPVTTPRPPMSVQSTTFVARVKPKIPGDTNPVRCTYRAPATPASAPPTLNTQILMAMVL